MERLVVKLWQRFNAGIMFGCPKCSIEIVVADQELHFNVKCKQCGHSMPQVRLDKYNPATDEQDGTNTT